MGARRSQHSQHLFRAFPGRRDSVQRLWAVGLLPALAPTGTRPPVEPAAHYPRVPTLVLQGELDALPFVPETARLYPQAKLITVVGAGHNTFSWGSCGGDLAVQFLETLKVTDSHCASETPMNYPGVTAFPRVASASPAATPDRSNQASPETSASRALQPTRHWTP